MTGRVPPEPGLREGINRISGYKYGIGHWRDPETGSRSDGPGGRHWNGYVSGKGLVGKDRDG